MAQTSNKKYTLYISKASDRRYIFNIENVENVENVYDNSIMYLFLNNDHFIRDTKIIKKDSFAINVVIHSADDLLNGQPSNKDAVYDFAQEILTLKGDSKNQPYPIIHITLVDAYVDALFGNDNLPLLIPRSFQIMDSSIWNYLVPMFDINFRNAYGEVTEIEKFQDVFYKAVDSIYKNYKKHLYNLHVAKEYADLNARLVSEAYLSGSHAKGVSPFIFHSERVIKKLIKDEFEDINDYVVEKIKERKWRLLLVDDKAIEEMEPKGVFPEDKDYYGYPWNCKIKIIRDLLVKNLGLKQNEVRARKYGNQEELNQEELIDCKILIEYVEDLDAAKDALKVMEYDLILLDYLLNNHEYGYELLDKIYSHNKDEKTKYEISSMYAFVCDLHNRHSILKLSNDDSTEEIFWDLHKNKDVVSFINRIPDLQKIDGNSDNLGELLKMLEKELKPYKVGPCDRYFFMFISAYSSAVYERLLAEGLNQSEKYWHINVGACPTNTPQLFLYNLIKLMDKRLNDSHIKKLSVDGIIDTLGKIYNQEGLIRKNAGEYYIDIQSYQYYYRTILKDYKVSLDKDSIFNTKGSVLMTDFMNNNINLGGLLEHMAQLVHLTAFGTVRQWSEMWEEYVYFKSQLASQTNRRNQSGFKTLCSNIESYIMTLKTSAL